MRTFLKMGAGREVSLDQGQTRSTLLFPTRKGRLFYGATLRGFQTLHLATTVPRPNRPPRWVTSPKRWTSHGTRCQLKTSSFHRCSYIENRPVKKQVNFEEPYYIQTTYNVPISKKPTSRDNSSWTNQLVLRVSMTLLSFILRLLRCETK